MTTLKEKEPKTKKLTQTKETVLIIDQAPANLNLLIEYLTGFGFKVVVIEAGQEALNRVAEVMPDIILLAMTLPDLDGFEVCHRLKAAEETTHIPVIFIGRPSHPLDKLKGFKLGAVDYLTTPLQCEAVLGHIRTHLTIRNLQQSLQDKNVNLTKENNYRKRVMAALRENSAQYQLLAENATDLISRQTPEGVYRYVSPACRELLGYEIEEMIGRSVFDFFHPDDRKAFEPLNGNGQDRSPISRITYRARRKDDSYIWLEATSQIIRDPKTNKPLETVAIARDISERKRAESTLRKAHDTLERRLAERVAELARANAILQEEIAERKRAEAEIHAYSEELKAKNEALSQLDKMKDEFLANTSHELRTPLNGIIGIAESMLDGATGQLTPEQMHNLAMVVFSARRLTNLVNDTLDFSKLKHRELNLELKAVDLHSVAEVVLTLSEPLVGQRKLKLVNLLNSDLPAVKADESRVQQIFHNLIGNAIKFTESGTVTVSAVVEDDMLAVTVSDTGIGIPPDKLDIIFESFEQVDASATRDYGGTGLGLSITKQLVELHGGTIRVESVVDEGAHFTFTLPLHKWPVSASVLNRAIDALTQETSPMLGEVRDRVDPVLVTPTERSTENKEYTILVVDDELINVQVLTNYLTLQNYDVVQAFDGFEALEAMDDIQPDLVLLDLMMPKMSGYEVCSKIRERYPAHQLPIVLLTAKNQASDLVAGFEAGANDYLAKPFDKNELLARVKTHLRLAKINMAYGRFVPHEFLRFLEKESIEDVKLGDQVQREMTILFSDIRSFTTLSEGMTPQQNFNFLNSYLGRVSPVIRQHTGFIDKYIGDALMALFPEQVEDALQSAIAIQHEVSSYNEHYRQQGWTRPIKVGIGIHTGTLMLGTIGEEMRMEGTVISDAVNLASRMEGLTKLYGVSIIISERSLFSLSDPTKYRFRFLDRVQVKGKKEPVSVFEIFDGDSEDIIALKLKTHKQFELGLVHYHRRAFEEAKAQFEGVLRQNPKDKAARFYLRRLTHFMKYGVPPGWEGVESLTKKR